jgi:hypothetical protein
MAKKDEHFVSFYAMFMKIVGDWEPVVVPTIPIFLAESD